jgi:hypothetical protein
VGDNIYCQKNGIWKWNGIDGYHSTKEEWEQDTTRDKVYISNEYYYFGREAFDAGAKHKLITSSRRGCKYFYEKDGISELISTIIKNAKGKVGKIADPYLLPKNSELQKSIKSKTC